MAELVVSALLGAIFSSLTSSPFRSLKLDGKWLNDLKSYLLRIDAILDDVDLKDHGNRELKLWFDKLKEVRYEIEDMLNEIVTEGFRREWEAKSRNIKSRVRGIVSIKSSFEKDIQHRWKSITKKIEYLQMHREKFGLEYAPMIARKPDQLSVAKEGPEDESQAWRSVKKDTERKRFQRPTSSLVTIPEVIGRDEDKNAILQLLMSENATENHMDAISIVGVSGVGKTTLAQLVYNHCMVNNYFELKGWIYVSDEFDVFRLTKTLLEVLTWETSDIKELSALQTRLKESLYMKRFLLILDDVWCEDYSFWQMMRAPLLAGARGSKIIVTTQSLSVARMMGSTLPAYCLKSLSYEDSRMLFAEHAFENTDSWSLYPELEAIGSEIIKKCDGLPLATVTLGRMLRSKPVEKWETVLKTNIFELLDDRSSVITDLLERYRSLPPHLKKCFAFCSIFPRDHDYEEEELIRLWMAEGLVGLEQPSIFKRIEEVGHDYFVDLTSMSFFQQSSTSKSHFVMNSLLNELAQFVSGEFFLRWQNHETTAVSHKVRHLSFAGDLNAERCQAICGAKSVRTLLSYELPPGEKLSCHLSGNVLKDLFKALKSLGVLSLSHYLINELPDSIGRLKLLQYLDLSYTQITRLPDNVSTLYNLQTLLLSYCRSLAGLPKKMGNLVNLRHLDIRETSLKDMPVNMGQLTNLQSLSDFVVGKDSGSKIKELGSLLNLQGTLHISQLQNVIPAGDAYEASLKKKAFLQGLELEWSNELEWGNAGVDSQNGTHVLKKLEPHKNLEKLSIISFSGIRFPDWLGDPSFSKMVFLLLSNCNSCLCLPPLGQLPSLKELEIEGMNGIERVGSEFYGMNPDSDKPFPSLEILVFRELTNWEEWISPEEEGENFPCLKQIRISGCLKLAKCLPLHLSSAKVEISECPLLRVPVTDGNKMQLENEYDIVSSELMTDVSSQTHSSCPELSMLSTELAIPKLPVTVDKQVHEGNSRKENILDRSSTSRLSKVEELQLPDTNVVRSTDVSITSNRPPPESPTHLTEDSSAKHGGALDTSLAATEISADTVTDDPINDEGDKAQFRRNEKVLDRPSTSRLQEIEELQLPVSDVVQRTDVLATSNSPPPESSERLTEDSSVKHEGASDNSSVATMILSDTNTDDPINDEGDKAQLRRNENLLDRPSTSRLHEIEELQLPDVNVPQITDVSITSNMPPPESPTRLTEDSTAKHEGASDNSSAPTEISSDTDDPINDEGDKAQFRSNEKLLDRPSTSRLQELEELQLPDSNVARRTAVLATSNSPPSESSKRLTEDSSIKYRGASDNSSAATEISSDSDTDNPINIWYDEESLEDISSPEQESLNVSEISQLKRLPPKLYSLKIEACKALKSLPEELMHSNLQHLYIINCQFLKSIQASHLPVPLKTLYIRKCKKLKFLSAEETTGKHASVEHLCIESSCDPLKSFPLSLFPKLKNLTIWDCVNFNTISITEDHMSLNSLEIRDCTNLESLSKGGLRTPNLTSILLSNCKNLKQLPGQLHELKSLQSLFINECPELDSIPEGGLPSSLNLLRISSCHKLTPGLQWGLHQLNNFSRIEIEGGCRDLESFPEQNLLPMKLNSLEISRFPNLKVLNYKGLQHLTSLQTLKINSCDKLQSLPEEGLPSSLSYLYISDCPLLKSKLSNNREDWYKIAHIPHIQINEKVIS